MKYVIDTCSLLSLVRYYIPFDDKTTLSNYIKSKIASGEIIIIDKVLEECKLVSGGIIIKYLSFLGDNSFLKKAKIPYNTTSLLPPAPKKFLNQLNNQFINHVVINSQGLSDSEVDALKNDFLINADAKQIILCLNLIHKGNEVILITEETESGNDNKLFKKIPAICKILNIKTMTIQGLLSNYDDIKVEFKTTH